MQFKGFDRFRSKIPMLEGKKIILLPIFAFIITLLGGFLLVFFYSLPEYLVNSHISLGILSLSTAIGPLLLECCGFVLIYQMWFNRLRLKKKYGKLAFQRIYFVGYGGIIWIIILGFNTYLPIRAFAPSIWVNSPISFLSISFVDIFQTEIIRLWLSFIHYILGCIIGFIGLCMIYRSFQAFGYDYMTLIYLYYPEESQIQDHQIYSVLRHPTYTGLLTIAFGGFIFSFTFYSLLLFGLLLFGFYIHVYFVEEKELIERFGDKFLKYRKQVPMFFIFPNQYKQFWRFLLHSS